MASIRRRFATLAALVLIAGCASAEDRLNEGVALQTQGRYMDAVYRYIDALEKDGTLVEARDRLLSSGDSAVIESMDEAARLEQRGQPVAAANTFRGIDRMLAAGRGVGARIPIPSDYSARRRSLFDTAIDWQMAEGAQAQEEGRYDAARGYFAGARGDYLPSRDQVEASFDAEEGLLLEWARIEMEDGRPRAAHSVAQQVLDLRPSPARELLLTVRDLQAQAVDQGTVVVAIAPVTADPGVRDYLGGEFEIALDESLELDHWNHPPLFVEVADPVILRRELRGLLRGRASQSPTVVGRALDLIGADLGVMVRLREIEVVERDVRTAEHQTTVVQNRGTRGVVRRGTAVDTVTYSTTEGEMAYFVSADIVLVDVNGREIERFAAESRQAGPFRRGDFDGDPNLLELSRDHAEYFDRDALADQAAYIEGALLQDLAGAIAAGTFDQVLLGIR